MTEFHIDDDALSRAARISARISRERERHRRFMRYEY